MTLKTPGFINKLVFAAALAALLSAAAFAAPDFTAKPAEAAQKAAPDTAQPVEAVQPPAAVQPLAAVEQPPAATQAVQPAQDTGASGEESEQAVRIVPSEGTGPAHEVYKVWLWQESRDCLWNIAKKYYGDPWQWKKIYLANQNQIKDPRLIYPRQELIIPPKDEPEKQ